jgi:hypothetical protein
MNFTLSKILILFVAAAVLLIRTASFVLHQPSAARVLQLCVSVALMIVVLTHVAEALSLFTFMGWGRPNSMGHYLDLLSLALGIVFLLVGHLMARRQKANPS